VGVSAASLVLARGAAATAASAAATARHARRAEDALTAWLPALSQVEIEHHETLLGRLAGR
jgi:hypothetical protein